jgi:integrase
MAEAIPAGATRLHRQQRLVGAPPPRVHHPVVGAAGCPASRGERPSLHGIIASTEWGLVQMLRRRRAQDGLPGLHPHQLRQTFADEWLIQAAVRPT